MPKETFGSVGQYHASVGWGSGELRVGTIGADGRSLNWTLYGSPRSREEIGLKIYELVHDSPAAMPAEDLGAAVLNILDCVPGDASGPDPAAYMGVWTRMERSEVNAFIKVLRRARDYAFGKDE
jgi:hypothetical protein